MSSQSRLSLDEMASERTPLLGGGSASRDDDFNPFEAAVRTTRQRTETEESEVEATFTTSNGEPGSLQKILTKYESLNYDTPENSLYMKEHLLCSPKDIIRIDINRWVVMLLIGIVTALIAVAIDICINLLASWKYSVIKNFIDLCTSGNCMAAPYSLWVAMDVLFVAVAAALVVFVEPVAAGSGIPQIKCYLNGVKVPHVVRLQTLFAKSVGVVFSVAGGLACGKEGPMIHSGAVIAAGISQGRSTTFNKDFHVWEYFRSDHEKRDFVSGGAAAGVAAAFGAPVGGVLFSLEEGASFWNQSLTWRMFFASMISTFTLNFALSAYNGDIGDLSNPGLINFGSFQGLSYSSYEIPLFLVMGIIGGLLGALFNAINHRLSIFRMKYVKKKVLRLAEAMVVAVMSASVAFLLIYLYQDCRPIGTANVTSPLQFFCEDGEYSTMGTLVFSTPEESIRSLFHLSSDAYDIGTVAAFFPLYFALATWTYGLYVPSGLFVPCILTGAAWGRLFGIVLHRLFPSVAWVEPGLYALVGAAATLGGVVRMTISLTVILMEATGNITYGLPMMLVLLIAKWVGDFFNEGIYDIHIKLQGVPFLGCDAPTMAGKLTASDIMNRNVVCFQTIEKVGRIVDVLQDTTSHHNGFPVVDYEEADCSSNRSSQDISGSFGTFRGLILRSQLIILLKQKVFQEKNRPPRRHHGLKLKDFRDAYPRFPPVRNVSISQRERECYVDLRSFMNPAPYTVHESASLSRVFRLFRALGLRHVVTVDDRNQVIGIVTRKDLARYRMWSHRGTTGLEEVHILESSGDHED